MDGAGSLRRRYPLKPVTAIAALTGSLLALGVLLHKGPITPTFVLENIASGAFAIAAMVTWFCWAEELWIFDPDRPKAKFYRGASLWARFREGAFFAIQAGCSLFAFFVNSLNPEPAQPMVPIVAGWFLGLIITFAIVKMEELISWALRKDDVLPPAVDHRSATLVACDRPGRAQTSDSRPLSRDARRID